MEIIGHLLALAVLALTGFFAYGSTILVDEKKRARRNEEEEV